MKENGINQTSDHEDHPQNTEDIRSPLSQEKLNEIFKISTKHANRVISRESSNLEFKESFGWKSLVKYLKTFAAFANTKGGYIVFGIGRRPHQLLGLSGSSLEQFELIDPEKMTAHLNEHFSPEITWDIHEYELNGKLYGILYIHECQGKPIVCKKDADNVLKEGDIYYRYRGRSERIKYSELRDILDLKRENEQRLWMQHFSRIAKIGVREVGIFDLKTGQVTGTNGSFLIDESLLSQLSFIKEGEFSEIKGKPTLKLIGNLEVISGLPNITSKKRIIKTKGIRISDIILGFLNLEKVEDPLEYLKQVCFENTAFLPIYFFMESAGLDNQEALKLINEVISRCQAKKKLLERLENNSTQYVEIPKGNTPAVIKKRKIIKDLKQKAINQDIIGEDLAYCLRAIRSLAPDDVQHNSEYLRKLLRVWFNRHYSSANSPLADKLRRAICWVDEALYLEGARKPC